MLLGDRRIDLANWESDFESSAIELDPVEFERHINPDHLPHAVIIDCTASEAIAVQSMITACVKSRNKPSGW